MSYVLDRMGTVLQKIKKSLTHIDLAETDPTSQTRKSLLVLEILSSRRTSSKRPTTRPETALNSKAMSCSEFFGHLETLRTRPAGMSTLAETSGAMPAHLSSSYMTRNVRKFPNDYVDSMISSPSSLSYTRCMKAIRLREGRCLLTGQ